MGGREEFRHREPREVQGLAEVGVLTAGPLNVAGMLPLVKDKFSMMEVRMGAYSKGSHVHYDSFRAQQRAAEFRNRVASER